MSVPFSVARTVLIAGNTFREAVRQKLLSLLVLLALGLTIGVCYLRDFNFGMSELKFIADFGDGAIAFFGAVLTVTATTQLFFSEIESRTALTLLAKAVWRAEFIVGKFLGVAAVAAAFCLLLTVALAGVLWSREAGLTRDFPDALANGHETHYGALIVAGWLQWLKLAMLAAGTLLIASFARTQLYTVMMGFALLVICHLQHFAQGASGARRAAGILIGTIFPDFQLFETDIATGIPWMQVARLTAYALGHVIVACALATYAFGKREI